MKNPLSADNRAATADLPQGWTVRTMGEVGQYLNGYAFSSKSWASSGRPIIRIQNLTGSGTEFNFYDGEVDDRYVVRDGDLLFSWSATLGVFVWRGPEAVLNQHIFKVVSKIDPAFHRYVIEHSIAVMSQQVHGSGMVHITKKKFEALPLCVPPFAEQQRIVEILEEQFSRLDAALENVRIVREKAAQLRRSLLHTAFTGELLGYCRVGKGLPSHWQTSPLEDLLSVSIGGIWGEEEGSSEIDVDVLRVTELKAHGVIVPSTAARRSVTAKQLASRALQGGDLLLEKSGGGPTTPVGRVGYVPVLEGPAICSNFMQLMRPNPDLIVGRYLFFNLIGFHSSGGTAEMQTATTNIRNIKASDYLKTKIAVPPRDEQVRIVNELESQFERLDSALAIADKAEARAATLRRSILHAAFTGKLTEQWRNEHAHV